MQITDQSAFTNLYLIYLQKHHFYVVSHVFAKAIQSLTCIDRNAVLVQNLLQCFKLALGNNTINKSILQIRTTIYFNLII